MEDHPARKKLIAWQVQADDIELEDDQRVYQLEYVDLFRNRAITNFLDIDQDAERLIVGGKGLGKTLLLKKKSFDYRRQRPGITRIPDDKLIDKMAAMFHGQVPRELLDMLKEWAIWRDLWSCAIGVAIWRRAQPNTELPANLDRIVDANKRRVSEIIVDLVKNKQRVNQTLRTWEKLSPHLYHWKDACVMFLDNVDEALKEAVQGNRYGADQPKADDMWINAQIGLIEAIRDLKEQNQKLRIFSTVRQEAFDRYPSQTRLQLQGMCCILSYTKQDVQQIFENNIKLLHAEDLAEPSDKDPVIRFFGIREAPHKRVVDERNRPVQETIFDGFYRHTLGRPRDLMLAGRYLTLNLRPAERRDPKALRDAGRKIARMVYEGYQIECVPNWKPYYDAYYAKLLDRIPSPILTRSQVTQLRREFLHDNPPDNECIVPTVEDPFQFFYLHGLLGVVDRDPHDRPIQRFRAPGTEAQYEAPSLPDSPLYFFHPCLDLKPDNDILSGRARGTELELRIIIGSGNCVPDDVYDDQVMKQTRVTLNLAGDGTPDVFWGRNDIAGLSKKFNTATILGYCALIAFSRNQSNEITHALLCQVVEELEKREIISLHQTRIGRKRADGPKNLVEYFRLQFAKLEPPEALNELNEKFRKGVGVNDDLYLVKTSTDGLSLGMIDYTQIAIGDRLIARLNG